MRVILIIASIVAVALAATNIEIERRKLQEIYNKCQANSATHVEIGWLHELSKHFNDAKVGAHMLCRSKGVGLQKPNGDLDLTVIKQKISLTITDHGKVEKLIKECVLKKETFERTAVNLFMCLNKNGVSYFHEF